MDCLIIMKLESLQCLLIFDNFVKAVNHAAVKIQYADC